MFHSVVGVVLPGTRKAPPMNTQPAEQARELRVALERDGEVRHRPERDEGQLTGPAARLDADEVRGVPVRDGPARRRQLGVAEPRGPWVSGVTSSARTSGTVPAQGDLDVGRPASSRMASVFCATWRASTFPLST